jgi:hypothetical protein
MGGREHEHITWAHVAHDAIEYIALIIVVLIITRACTGTL